MFAIVYVKVNVLCLLLSAASQMFSKLLSGVHLTNMDYA